MIIRVHRTHSHVRRSTASAMLTVDATSINTRTAYAEAHYNGAVSVRLSLPGQRARQKQSNGLCNSFHCLGHPKNVYDDDDDDDESCRRLHMTRGPRKFWSDCKKV